MQAGELLAPGSWCGGDQGFERVDCFGAGSDGTGAGGSQDAEAFDVGVGGFRFAEVVAGEDHRCCSGRVVGVGFAVSGTALPVGAADFGDLDAGGV